MQNQIVNENDTRHMVFAREQAHRWKMTLTKQIANFRFRRIWVSFVLYIDKAIHSASIAIDIRFKTRFECKRNVLQR